MADSTKKVFIETHGCQMNVLDSELVQGQLAALGFSTTSRPNDAQVVLINTCSVREHSEHKVWSRLGVLAEQKKLQPDLVVGLLGCMAEREGHNVLKRAPHVDVVCGPSDLDKLPNLLQNAAQNLGPQISLAGHTSRRSATLEAAEDGVTALDLSRSFSAEQSAHHAYVRITRGCNKFCSFCVVPYTRGPEIHRSPDQIVTEVQRLVDHGALEITLLGQTVNHYVFHDGGKTTSFADLLWHIHESVPALPRLRFLTSYPRDFGDDALAVMRDAKRICRYLHIPAQSGSNRLLKLMNRGYTVEDYDDLLSRARSMIPDVRIAGDMIVGFPTETEADHQESLALLKRARYKNCFIFKYSPRPGTIAAKRLADEVPETIKKRRNLELLDLQNKILDELHGAQIGQTVEVLVDNFSHKEAKTPTADNLLQPSWLKKSSDTGRLVGRTRGDEIVVFSGPENLVGQLVDIELTGFTTLTLRGELAAEPSGASLGRRGRDSQQSL